VRGGCENFRWLTDRFIKGLFDEGLIRQKDKIVTQVSLVGVHHLMSAWD